MKFLSAVHMVWQQSTLLERTFFVASLLVPAYVFFDRLHYRKAGLSGDFAVFAVVFLIVYPVALLGLFLVKYREAKQLQKRSDQIHRTEAED
jgi:hypothetical protein